MKGINIKKIAVFSSSTISGLLLASMVFAEGVTLNNPIKATDFKSFLLAVATGVATIIGPAALLMIVVSGVLFVTSAGDPGKLKTAKTCLTYAIIGALVAGTAEIIVNTFLK